jgi:peptide/nickel transport system substrate-binding protein
MKHFKTILLASAAMAVASGTALADGHSGPRGRDGEVKIIYWQAPSTLNPYLSAGTKDIEAASMIIEPLARFDENGELVPYLVDEIPTLENGGISADSKKVTWKLSEGVQWSDGTPVTSADVAFTAEYCMHPEGGCAQAAKFDGISSIETPDARTIVINYTESKYVPYSAFVGGQSPIIQKAQFQDCLGAKAPECTDANFSPTGTGPFKVVEFKPNDVITMEANNNYREEGKPAFASVTFKGGGSAADSGRAVMETGEFDYGWNLQLAPDVLASMAKGGKGTPLSAFGTLVERIEMNLTNPSPDLPDGERATAKHPHPILSDERVRRALSMAIDRPLLVEIGYGQAGRPTCNLVPSPVAYASNNTGCLTQDIAGAKALLDDAGWKDTNGDGVREKDGMDLRLTYQTSTNAVRQDFQSIIKQNWAEIGVDTELRNIDASVFFGGDPASPDTFQKFYSDVEMYANNFDGTDPEQYLTQYTCEKAPRPETQWQGENINRFCSEEYDAMAVELGRTGDPAKRQALAKKMNDALTKDTMTIVPLVDRGRVSAAANTLGGVVLNTWDSELWNVADWYRKK